MKNIDYTDERCIQRTFAVARKGLGKVGPNPMVGCVIVKNNRIISTGYHPHFSGPHAEIVALHWAGKKSRGATMYVNLEPCCHFDKKTPPCVPEIIKAGIKKVVIAMKDPNPQVNGKGIEKLRVRGVKCKVGILENEANALNKTYIKWITKKMPYVILKSAMSIDGKIAVNSGDSEWISSEKSRKFVHKLRSQVDAVLVGINTVLIDNPHLTTHSAGGKSPVRVIIDPHLRISPDAFVLNSNSHSIVFCDKLVEKKCKQKLELLEKKSVKTVRLTLNNSGELNFKQIMKFLASQNISSVLIEGGGETNALALKHNVVDEIMFFIAPKIIGGRNAKTPVEGNGIKRFSNVLKIDNFKVKPCGDDFILTGKLKCLQE